MMRKMTMRMKKRTKTRMMTRMRRISPMRRTIITKMLIMMRMRRFLQQSQTSLALILNQTRLLLHQKRKLLQRLRSLNLRATFSLPDIILSGKKIQFLRVCSHPPLKICSPFLVSQCPSPHLCPISSKEVWGPSRIRANLRIITMTTAADGVWWEVGVYSSGNPGSQISAII